MITFIIPCFNQISFTKECINSLSSSDCNFIFIDNGSTDGTYEYLKSVSEHVIRNENNVYVNPAWNQGLKYFLEHDFGEYFCIANNDIVFHPECVRVIEEILSKKDVFLMPSMAKDIQEMGSVFCKDHLVLNQILIPTPGFCIFLKKKYFPLFYPIPETIKVLRGDDWIMDNLHCKGIFGYAVNKALTYHHYRTTQKSLNLGNMITKDVKEFERIVEKQYPQRGIKRIYEFNSGIKIL